MVSSWDPCRSREAHRGGGSLQGSEEFADTTKVQNLSIFAQILYVFILNMLARVFCGGGNSTAIDE